MDKDSNRSLHRALWAHRSFTCIYSCRRASLVVHRLPNSVPAAATWSVCKAILAAQVSHDVGRVRFEWEAIT
jgi:hypothetical protein